MSLMLSNFLHLFLPHNRNNHKAKILHTNSLVILLGLFIMAQSSLSLFDSTHPAVLGYASLISPQKVIALTNKVRQNRGIKPLRENAKLTQAATAKAADMFARNYWAHNAPDGTQPWSFILNAGYSYLHAGENLARDFNSPEGVVDAWVKSPSHNANLINSKYTDIGVAVVDGKLNNVDTTLVVQMFGSLQNSTPSIRTDATSIVREALAVEAPPIERVQVSPLDLSRSISLAFVILILITLAFDWFIVYRRNLIRLSGKNWAHLTYFLGLFIILILLKQGLIL